MPSTSEWRRVVLIPKSRDGMAVAVPKATSGQDASYYLHAARTLAAECTLRKIPVVSSSSSVCSKGGWPPGLPARCAQVLPMLIQSLLEALRMPSVAAVRVPCQLGCTMHFGCSNYCAVHYGCRPWLLCACRAIWDALCILDAVITVLCTMGAIRGCCARAVPAGMHYA
eukprot:1146634-Pelagomonas_calceolata.AAC.1